MTKLTLLGAGGAEVSAIAPDELDNLMLWVKADLGVKDAGGDDASDGENVATWQDQSGNGRDFTQGTDGNRPTFETNIQNGQPIVRFTRANSSRLINTTNAPEPGSTLTFFAVVDITNLGSDGNQFFYSNGRDVGGGDGYFFQVQTVSGTSDRRVNTVAGNIIADGNNSQAFEIWEVVRQATGTIWEIFINGSSEGTSTDTSGSAATARITLGARDSTGYDNHATCDIAEVILYDDVLTVPERTGIRDYLNNKYSIF